MSIYTNLSLSFAQMSSLDPWKFLSDNSRKFAIITAVALAILGVAAAVYYAVKCYSAKKIYAPSPLPSPLPVPHHSPKPIPNPPKVDPEVYVNPPPPLPPFKTPQGSPQPEAFFSVIAIKNGNGKQTDADDKQKPHHPPQKVDDADALAFAEAQRIAQEEEELERALRESVKEQTKPVEPPTPPIKDDLQEQIKDLTHLMVDTSSVGIPLDVQDWNLSQFKDKDPAPLTPVPEPVKPEVQPAPAQPKKPNVPYAPFSELVDQICDEVANNVFIDPNYSTTKAFNAIPHKTHQQILAILNELVAEFEKRHNRHHNLIKYQDPVPAYFAQVDDFGTTSEDKKYLALVGIRNMLAFGPRIIDDFCRQHFLGGAHHYGYDQGPNAKGLNLFKYYTGTVVDLDTVVEAKSDQEAILKAKELIVQFGKRCGMTGFAGRELTAEDVAAAMPNRKLHLPKNAWDPIPQSQSNTDRSNHGIWKRQNPQTMKMEYFVNVPNCELVVAATLRFPYMIAELAWRAKEANGGKFSDEFLKDFFKEGLSTMCFNDKMNRFINFQVDWKAKFDGSETPEETVRGKIESGALGEELRNKGADQAMKEAFTQKTLTNFLDQNLNVGGMEKESWIKKMLPICVNLLKQQKRWTNTLYRTDNTSEYFLLDENAVVDVLKPLYDVILADEKFDY